MKGCEIMAAKNATPYVHKVEIDGKTVELTFKPFNQAPAGIIRRNRANATAGLWELFEWGLSAEDLAKFDALPIEVVNLSDIADAWQEDGKVSLGE